MFVSILILVGLLILSAFFSSSETALTSLDKIKLRTILESKNSKYLKKLKEDMHLTLMTILLGNNLVNILASSYASVLAYQAFNNSAIAITTGVLTVLILIFGEIIPKTLGLKHAQKFSLFISPIIYFMKILFYPILKIIDLLIHIFIKQKPFEEMTISEKELIEMMDLVEEDGDINPMEKEIMSNVMDLSETRVGEIQTPRHKIVSIDIKSKILDVRSLIINSGFSRIPVYEKNLDQIKGIIFAKDLLKIKDENITLNSIIRDNVLLIPEFMKIGHLLKQFQTTKSQIAIIIDEFGTVTGLISMEDILEELVGEIFDEDEIMHEDVIKINKDEFLLNAHMNIDDFEEKLKIKLPSGDYDTIGGYILNNINKIPNINEEFEFDNFKVKILKKENNAITKLKLYKVEKNETENQSED